MKPVAIIGVGPAGLLAAWGCHINKVPYVLFGIGAEGRAFKSEMGGSQFLHESVEGMTDPLTPDAIIKVSMNGNMVSYRQKVYGVDNVPYASVARMTGQAMEMPAWSLVSLYDDLWYFLADDGEHVEIGGIGPEHLDKMLSNDQFQAIVCTIPKTIVCFQGHEFNSQAIRITEGSEVIPDDVDNMILYDATPNHGWYRTARVFGAASTEFGHSHQHVHISEEHVTRRKPMFTNCDCWEGTVNFAGRYGAWDKALLTHDAFKLTNGMFK